MLDFNLNALLRHPHYGLLGLLACLFGSYLTLVWRTGDLAYFGMSVLFLLTAATLIWENHSSFTYRPEPLANVAGIGLIGWVIWQSANVPNVPNEQLELRLFPFISALAVTLIAAGFQGVLQYRRELAIMFFLGVPSLVLSLIDISPLTAIAAAKLLLYAGFQVTRQGALLISPVGEIEVYSSSSGMGSITHLLGIAVICLTLYPVCRFKQVLTLLAAVVIGFGVNSIRVAVMATLAAPTAQKALLYWHEGDGSLIFAVITLLVFTAFYWLLHQIELWQRRLC